MLDRIVEDRYIQFMYLFVDDLRDPPEGWELARDFDQAIEILRLGQVEALSLDHDLGAAKSGYDVALFVEFNNLWPDVIACHSGNPVGRQNIERAIEYSGLYGYKQVGSIGNWTGVDIWYKK